jgi:hypothetical protein
VKLVLEPYGERLGATDKVSFEEAFGQGFRNGSPFEQPYIAFLSAIIGSVLLSDIAFARIIPVDRRIEYPGVWVGTFSVGVHDACRTVISGMRQIESELVISIAQQIVVFCHARVEACDDGSTEFDFFRHLRNACAHGNKFTFRPRTTGLPARWRGAEINRGYQGHKAILGLVGIPDVILLLKDIEDRLPPTAFSA